MNPYVIENLCMIRDDDNDNYSDIEDHGDADVVPSRKQHDHGPVLPKRYLPVECQVQDQVSNAGHPYKQGLLPLAGRARNP